MQKTEQIWVLGQIQQLVVVLVTDLELKKISVNFLIQEKFLLFLISWHAAQICFYQNLNVRY